MTPHFEFDWDPAKARANVAKHGISFEEAMAVFLDPLALSRPDPDSSQIQERWITMGLAAPGLTLVVHTHVEIDDNRIYIRVISARRPTGNERRQYEQG